MKKNILKSLFVLAACFLTSGVQAGGNGTTAANFLTLVVGARASALGEAYSAWANDATALYWNPAGLNRIEKRSVAFMHATYLNSSSFDYLAYGQKLGNGTLGAGLQYFSAGDIDKRNTNNVKIGTFGPNDLAVSLGYARSVGDLLPGYTWGASVKYIRSTLVDSASTFALDLGALSPAYFDNRATFAITLSNLGSGLKYTTESDDLPRQVRVGNVTKILDHWSAGVDVVVPQEGDTFVALGTEYDLPLGQTMSVALRTGYNTQRQDVEGFTGFTFGTGLVFQGWAVDYGFIPYGNIDNTHRISLSYKF
jgi:hypothetical protein